MRRIFILAVLAVGVTLAGARDRAQAPDLSSGPPPDAATLQAFMDRVVANQHHNDAALIEYERREHRVTYKKEQDEHADEDKLFRVVPTGTGTLRLILEERGQPVKPEYYREQLRILEQGLAAALDSHEAKQKQRVQKFEKRNKERYDTVEAVRGAFHFTWLGRETQNGRTLVKVQLDPAPDYDAHSRTTEMFAHVRVVAWMDASEAQVARLEAEVVRDIPIGGGILGKVYKGSRFVMEQTKVADGVWLPTRFQYSFRGRKFVFGFELHEQTEASLYHRIGPPEMALAAIRRELIGAKGSGSSH